MVVVVSLELPSLAERTCLILQVKCIHKFLRAAFWTSGNRLQRIHYELLAARKTDVRLVISDAPAQILLVRMVGVLLLALMIQVVRIAIGPGFNFLAAARTHKTNAFGHGTHVGD